MQDLERAISIYDTWMDQGRPVPASTLIERHPELADLLSALMGDRSEIERAVADADPAQRTLGEFRILGEIGRGGMGVVYRARQSTLDREVALKVLAAHITLDASAVARFRREASLAARLEHPGIVAIHAVGGSGDTWWFAMEFIDGAPLSRLDPLTGAARSVRQCVEIAASVCDALQHAHDRGVLHRDVKPANILIRRDGRPVLTDFGLARDVDQPGLTRTGAFAGTPNYTAPEQARGERDLDGRTDVYALGVTLYELLTGRLPFEGHSVTEVLDKISRADAPDPLRLCPELSPDLAAIVMKAIEKEPHRRYAGAGAFAADLRAFLEFRPILARRATWVTRARRWARREPWRATAALLLCAAVPLASLAAGFVIANRTAITVGAAELERRAYEEALARLTIDLEAGDYEAAARAATAAIAARPHDIEPHLMRAMVQAASGSGEAALAGLQQSIARDALPFGARAEIVLLDMIGRVEEAKQRETALPPPRAPEELYFAGLVATQRGTRDLISGEQWRAVRDQFLRAMLVAPTPRLHYYLKWAGAVGWTGDRETTDQCNATLLHLWPDSPAAQLYVAFSLRNREPARAIELYRRVLAAGYDHPRIHTTIGDCYEKLGDQTAARLANDTGVAAYLRREAEGRLGDTEVQNLIINLQQIGRAPEALERARALVARHPDVSRGHMILGWLLQENGDVPGAIAACNRALELNPRDGQSLDRLGTLQARAGDHAAAAAAFARLAAIVPDSPRVHFLHAKALRDSGDRQAAEAAFDRAAAATKDPAHRAEIERERSR